MLIYGYDAYNSPHTTIFNICVELCLNYQNPYMSLIEALKLYLFFIIKSLILYNRYMHPIFIIQCFPVIMLVYNIINLYC